jgi:hypothetical protein
MKMKVKEKMGKNEKELRRERIIFMIDNLKMTQKVEKGDLD